MAPPITQQTDLAQAYRETVFGRFEMADQALGLLSARTDTPADLSERTWFHVLQAQRWFADLASGHPPSRFDSQEFSATNAQTRSAASRLCALGQRRAVLEYARADALLWSDLHRQVVSNGVDESGALWFDVSEGWRALIEGAPDQALEFAERASVGAAKQQEADVVLEAVALKALASSALGDHEAALNFARRASRMARTESMPQQEYLANVVLARARRLAGQPHLAAFILSALRRFAPSPWHRWIDWELSLSPTTSAPSEEHVGAMYRAAAAGDRTAYGEAGAAAVALGAWLPDIEKDTQTLVELIDPTREVSAEVRAWAFGETHESPRGLQGVVPADVGPIALVYTAPSTPVRRFLICGAPLIPVGTVVFEPEPAHIRTDTAIATLLLAGPAGLDGDLLWRLVYGFAFIHEKHRKIRNTLHLRVRKRLGEHATLTQEDSMWSIALQTPLCVPDPRCLLPREHVLLNLLARAGTLTATHVAQRMGIPLRTAQQTLKELANDGACQAERAGREMRYRLEDTTFCEPTVC